jgi:DNA-directed RNA polymerase subunit beta'
VLDDRTARTYDLEGGFDVFPPDNVNRNRDSLLYGRPSYGFDQSDNEPYSPILDDEGDFGNGSSSDDEVDDE